MKDLEPDQDSIDAYIVEIAPTFGEASFEADRWVQNGLILCGRINKSLARTRMEDIERDNERTVRTVAAIRHFCPARIDVIDNPEDYLDE